MLGRLAGVGGALGGVDAARAVIDEKHRDRRRDQVRSYLLWPREHAYEAPTAPTPFDSDGRRLGELQTDRVFRVHCDRPADVRPRLLCVYFGGIANKPESVALMGFDEGVLRQEPVVAPIFDCWFRGQAPCSEASLLRSASRVLQVEARYGQGTHATIFWGRSIGSRVALDAALKAAEANPDRPYLLVMEGAYSSLRSAAQHVMAGAPELLLDRDNEFDSAARIDALEGLPPNMKVIQLHLRLDQVVDPADQSRLLASLEAKAVVGNQVQCVTVAVGHTDNQALKVARRALLQRIHFDAKDDGFELLDGAPKTEGDQPSAAGSSVLSSAASGASDAASPSSTSATASLAASRRSN